MNSELLYITRKLGYPSSFGTRAGLGDFLEQYPDGIYAETGAGAPMGWESAAVWFGGDSERAAARFERMMSERNEMSRVFRTRIAGVLLLTFIYRLKSRMVTAIPIIGGQPQPIDPTGLYFTMPQGGTVSLTKNGSPTVVTLEYSLDNGSTWTEWVESENVRSLTLADGQTMHVRNNSETSTGFSTSNQNEYRFAFTNNTYAGGNINSLLCKNPDNAIITEQCLRDLFYGQTNLITAPNLPALVLERYCYARMFYACTNLISPPEIGATTQDEAACWRMFYQCFSLKESPELKTEVLATQCYQEMFYGCTNLKKLTTLMTNISASNCLTNWLSSIGGTGDFYCPAELTIPTGGNGIPSGWTRHDI